MRAAATTIDQASTQDKQSHLSYDYIFDRSACGDFSPVILDSDGALRWVSPFSANALFFAASTFFNNAVYVTHQSQLLRIELDGTVLVVQTITASE